MTPDALIEKLMERVRTTLFKGLPDRAWFQQQVIVKRALTFPAAWLEERKVQVPAARYQAILEGILTTILANGRASKGSRPSAYLYACIERHMQHHGDDYYEEGKAIRNRLRIAMPDLEKARIGADGTVPIFAQVHATLDAGKRKPKVKSVNQETDLFL